MKLIQNWKKEDKDKLLEFIIEKINCEYRDICIVGSRIFGGFRPNSDIDILVFIDNYNIKRENIRGQFNKVNNAESIFNNFKICIKLYDYKEFDTYRWTSFNYFLPKYSLVTDTYYEGNKNHIKHHQLRRKLIRDYKGTDVPFDEFNKKYEYLLK